MRLGEIRRYCDALGVPLVEDEYDHEAWLNFVLERETPGRAGGDERGKALAQAPERGERCLNCFKFRLMRAACYAAEHGFPVLTTTLASSRWKSLEQVDAAGALACATTVPGPTWWPQNWRKGGLQPRRAEIIQEQNFYNQNYCGCEFSKQQ